MDRKLKATTLIEMIIVMTIFSVIGAAIATSFMAGMRIWGRVNNRDFKHNFILLEIESIARRIRQSIGIKEVECFGKAREFSFLTFKADHIIRVTYIFDAENKQLLLTEETLAAVLSKQEAAIAPAEKIFELEDLTFNYFLYDHEKKQYSWADSWGSDKEILAGVKIKLKFKNDEITKTIFMQKV
ncbi:MAG: type II secretion system protein [Candidatus Omnitrophota bacterium]